MENVKIYAKSILIPVVLGAIVGLITSGAMNNQMLIKPLLSPPGWLFPIVWTILYTLMGISYGILEENSQVDDNINLIYYGQLVVNLLWSIIFFSLKLRLLASIWVVLLLILIIKMIVDFYAKNKTAGLLQIPYLIWVSFATYLTIATYILNK